jgi:glycosyltransferase involved in cell wall biosynthesis
MSDTRTTPRTRLSIVVPTHNEAPCLTELHQRLRQTLTAAGIDQYELIFVDDGSRDQSREVIRQLRKHDARVKLVALTRNFGHQLAITAGLDCSRGEAVIVMDADLQDPPEVIPEFMAKWREGYDVVYGVRLVRPSESWFKRGTAWLFYRVLRKLTSTDIAVDAGDFRLLSRRAVNTFTRLRERSRFVRGMISWIGYPQAPIYYHRAPRLAGQSTYPLRKQVKLALDAIVSFSDVPLRLASWLGFIGVGVCLVYLSYALAAKLIWGATVQGWASMVAIVLFIGSVQLTVLGLLGQYVGRIYEELKGRPLYVLEEREGFEDTDGTEEDSRMPQTP